MSVKSLKTVSNKTNTMNTNGTSNFDYIDTTLNAKTPTGNESEIYSTSFAFTFNDNNALTNEFAINHHQRKVPLLPELFTDIAIDKNQKNTNKRFRRNKQFTFADY
mmetsp:Transcript_64987/g.79535  ORF Transcript_64987/g.79535 Transcript_64987/m.79535 type:complete len:106 (-) Transcript_64987:257-574(-)